MPRAENFRQPTKGQTNNMTPGGHSNMSAPHTGKGGLSQQMAHKRQLLDQAKQNKNK